MHVIRYVLLFAMVAALLAACGGDDDEEPTQTPIVIVATNPPTNTPEEDDSDATEDEAEHGASPTQDAKATPTEDAQPTADASPTAESTPTTQPTQGPLPTRPTITLPTPPPGEPTTDRVQLPDDPLLILPQAELAPEGMVLTDEGLVSIDYAASDAPDRAARVQQLTEWGFQGGAFRDVETPDEQLTDPANQLLLVSAMALILGAPDGAQAEMHSYMDTILLTDPDISLQEVSVEPIGDGARGATGSITAGEDAQFNIGALLVTAGPVSLKYLGLSGANVDPMPVLVQAARISLDNLRFASYPQPGEVLLETTFDNWFTGPLETGEIFIGDDGFYHLRVDAGGGSFVSAYATGSEPWGDVAVSADLMMISGDPTSTGCVLTRLDGENQTYDYALCVDGNGNVEALYEQFDAEGNYSNEVLLPFGTATVAPPTEWTTLTIITRGQEFWFLVDGQLVGQAQHAGPPSGTAGVIVNHFAPEPQAPAEFIFGTLRVQALQ